ncbi:regulatory protein Spx [Streptococcus pneumoniae]|nr:regulatory protein Spx [Streptococcus pneumoniae]
MVLMTSFQLVQKLNIDVESISVSELLHLIEQYPSLLRRPIIIDAKRMQIGFNEDEIRAFLPRSYRKQELKEARMRAGIS